VIFTGTASHTRHTIEDAMELAWNVARYGRTEVKRFFWVDDPDEGIVQNSVTVVVLG